MRILPSSLGLTLVWVLSSGSAQWDVVLTGLVLSLGVLTLLGHRTWLHPTPRNLVRGVVFAGAYFVDFLRSCLQVARQVAQPLDRLRPAVVEVPIESRSDREVALLANLVSFSPGTLCLDVSEDGKSMFVHVMSLKDADELVRYVREDLERHVLEALR